MIYKVEGATPKSISKRHSIFDSLYDTLISSPYRLHSIYIISFQ
jgi:hypothetical protein